MAKQTPEERANELAESFINGNRSYVAEQIVSEQSTSRAARLALLVCESLTDKGGDETDRRWLRQLIANRDPS